jgi:hypothetical protein
LTQRTLAAEPYGLHRIGAGQVEVEHVGQQIDGRNVVPDPREHRIA